MTTTLKTLCLSATLTLLTATAMAQPTDNNNMDLSAQLLRQNIQTQNVENVCLSPLSLQMALAMLGNGAESTTRDEILRTMGWSGKTINEINASQEQLMHALSGNKEITLQMANSIWINKRAARIKRTFVKTCSNYYDAEVARLTFNTAAAARINKWVASHTKGKITGIIDQIEPAAPMYLINALYMKGSWVSTFDEAGTTQQSFFTAPGQEVETPMMHRQGYYNYTETAGNQIIDMPLVSIGKQDYSMYVLLPSPQNSVDAMLQTLNSETWRTWISGMESEEVNLSLPKFKVEYSSILNQTLQSMGMTQAFQAGAADFSGISNSPLHVDQVLQKTYIDVNESGLEAAAVTSISMMMTSLQPPHEIKTMNVCRPFLFVIAERSTGNILFIGKVTNPRQSK